MIPDKSRAISLTPLSAALLAAFSGTASASIGAYAGSYIGARSRSNMLPQVTGLLPPRFLKSPTVSDVGNRKISGQVNSVPAENSLPALT